MAVNPQEPSDAAGLARDPAITTPPRAPCSMRRTSHIDMIPLGPSMMTGLELRGAARDVWTGADGHADEVDSATVRASVGEGRVLEALDTSPREPGTGALVGLPAASGFRAAVDAAVPRHRDAQTPLYLLLDELPVAALISGYADLYLRAPGEPEPEARRASQAVRADICAGWARDATMMRAIEREGRIPVPIGPPNRSLERPGDPWSWHEVPPLVRGAMRRRRRIDVVAGEPLRIGAMFRDTHVGPDGTETVLHEYCVDASADAERLELNHCVAHARVLPWIECPSAAASAARLVGQRADRLRAFVRNELVGTSTCTHLNDLLRSLADVAPLAFLLRERSSGETRGA